MSTVDLDARERGRLHLQARLDAARPAAERNRLGQFATPPTLARAVAREGLAARGDGPLRFLDPAVGTGAFYAALRAELGGQPLDRAVGVELDEGVHRAAAGLWTGHPVELRRADFTRLTPAPAFDLILCNPP